MLNEFLIGMRGNELAVMNQAALIRLNQGIDLETAMKFAAYLAVMAEAAGEGKLPPFDDYMYAIENDLDAPTPRPKDVPPVTEDRTTGLSFRSLRQANMARLPQFKNNKGEPAHSRADGYDWSINDWLTAVVGEIGEFANNAKKLLRGDLSVKEFDVVGAKELADVQIYLDLLAYRCGFNLAAITVAKFNETSHKVESDVRLDEVTGEFYQELPRTQHATIKTGDGRTEIFPYKVEIHEGGPEPVSKELSELQSEQEVIFKTFYGYADPFSVSIRTEEEFTEAGGKSLAWGNTWKRIQAPNAEAAAKIMRYMQPALDHDKPIRKAFEEFDLARLDVIAKPFPAVKPSCDDLDLMSVNSMLFRIANPDDSLKERAPFYGTWYINGICSVLTEEQFSGIVASQSENYLPIYAQSLKEAGDIIRKWSLAAYDVCYGPIEYLAQFYQRGSVGMGARPPGKPNPNRS